MNIYAKCYPLVDIRRKIRVMKQYFKYILFIYLRIRIWLGLGFLELGRRR